MSDRLLVNGDIYCSINWIALQIQEVSTKQHFRSKVFNIMLNFETANDARERIVEELEKPNSTVSAAIIQILIEWKTRVPDDAKLSTFLQTLKNHDFVSYAKAIEDKLGNTEPLPGGHKEIHKHADHVHCDIEANQELNNNIIKFEQDEKKSVACDDTGYNSNAIGTFKNSDTTTKADKLRQPLLSDTNTGQVKNTELRAPELYDFILLAFAFLIIVCILVVALTIHGTEDIQNSRNHNPNLQTSCNNKSSAQTDISNDTLYNTTYPSDILFNNTTSTTTDYDTIIDDSITSDNPKNIYFTEDTYSIESIANNVDNSNDKNSNYKNLENCIYDNSENVTSVWVSLQNISQLHNQSLNNVPLNLYFAVPFTFDTILNALSANISISMLCINDISDVCKETEFIPYIDNSSLDYKIFLPFLKTIVFENFSHCNNILSLFLRWLVISNVNFISYHGLIDNEVVYQLNDIWAKTGNSLKYISVAGTFDTQLEIFGSDNIQRLPNVEKITVDISNQTETLVKSNIVSSSFCNVFSGLKAFEMKSGYINAQDFINLVFCSHWQELNVRVALAESGNALKEKMHLKKQISMDIALLKLRLKFEICPSYEFSYDLIGMFTQVQTLILCYENCYVEDESTCVELEGNGNLSNFY